jgi:hypothetical protein
MVAENQDLGKKRMARWEREERRNGEEQGVF